MRHRSVKGSSFFPFRGMVNWFIRVLDDESPAFNEPITATKIADARWLLDACEERKRLWAKVERSLREYVNLEPAYFVPLIDDRFDREVMLPGLIRSMYRLDKIEHELGGTRGLRVVK